MSIVYKKMSLFDAPSNSYLMHACNSEGIWGAGIAKEIHKRYTHQFWAYNEYANESLGSSLFDAGYTLDEHIIVNLVTSSLGSQSPDKEDEILINTTLALENFFQYYTSESNAREIYCNKFNSGLFNVPWAKTEKILKILSNKHGITVTVCDPNLDDNFDGITIE